MQTSDNGLDPVDGTSAPAVDGATDVHIPAPRAADVERSLALLDALFGDAPVGLALYDTDLRYLRVNEVLHEIIGLPDTDLVGRRISEAMPGFGDIVVGHLERVLATGEAARNLELWGQTPANADGRHCYLCSYFRLHGRDGAVIGVGGVVLDVTKRRVAETALTTANERLALLSRAGQLLGKSLDVSQTLDALAELTVPSFADHCIVDLLESSDPLRFQRAALVHAEPVPAAGLAAWRGTSGSLTYPDTHPVVEVVRTRTGMLVRHVEDAHIERSAPTLESGTFATAVGLRSAIVVPLVARGAVLGVLSFAQSVSGRRYTDADLELAMEVAGRTAVALDNAHTYERQRSVALTLQRSLLPDRLPAAEGLTFESCYLPGVGDTEVGGDWFDVIPLSTGRTGIVIGDVMGRGVRAAAVMGQLRAATRSCAVLDLPPAALLRHLDEIVQQLDAVQIVTCVYGVYDPVSCTLVVANAGHLPPLLRRATTDGGTAGGTGGAPQRCEVVELDTGAPLGLGGTHFVQQEITLRPGDTFYLYTDGLVESRDNDLDAGIERLRAELCAVEPAQDTCAAVLRALGHAGAHDDDVAMLVLHATEKDPSRAPLVLTLRPQPDASRTARLAAVTPLADWGYAHRGEVVSLLVSELVTNAVRHAGTDVHLRVWAGVATLYVEVGDGDTRAPRVREHPVDGDSGRGLHLVDALANRWGVRTSPTGKVVWFEVAR